MKQYKKKIIITSIITVLPMLLGIILWNRLPDTIATHFGTDNTPNGWSSKLFVVFGMPILLLFIHLLCIGVTLNDPKKKNIGKMMLSLMFWVVPVTSVIVHLMTYAYAIGIQVDIGLIANILVGVIFIIIGNYMSKNRQNYTVGIKIPWTLSSEENWDKTHRLASKLWVLAGVSFLINAYFKGMEILLITIAAAVFIPTIYSFVLYKKSGEK